jgi:hypothetical protein
MDLEKAFQQLLAKLTDKGILTLEETVEIFAVLYPDKKVHAQKNLSTKTTTKKPDKKKKESAGSKALKQLGKMLE